jgi:hypothetical protein
LKSRRKVNLALLDPAQQEGYGRRPRIDADLGRVEGL